MLGQPIIRQRKEAISMKTLLKTALLAAGVGVTAPAALAQTTVYIPLGSGNQVIAVDAATDRIIKTYEGIENPHGLIVTPDGEYIVAGSLHETKLPQGVPIDTPNSKLSVIHPVHGHVMSTIPVAGWTHHQAITPDGKYVISTHPTRGGISVADLEANKVVKVVLTGAAANYAVVTPDGRRVFVTNTGDGTVSEIDAATWKVRRKLEGGPSPEHMVLSADAKTLYVASERSGRVSAVSIASGKVTRAFELGKRLHGIDLGDDGRTLFVSVISDDKLVALDPQSGAQRTLALAPAPYHLGAVRGAGKVYVSSRKEPKIWVVDQKTLGLVGTIALPAGEGHQIGLSR
jgi:YVTN family beta-propeller protein